MTRRKLILTGVLGLIAAGLSVTAQPPSLHGTSGITGVSAPDPVQGGATEVLQVGDYGPEIGIGCSNGAGTSGGPNEMVLGVTATSMPVNFFLQSVSYNLFTNISPTITHLLFALWKGGGASPGATGFMMKRIPFTGSGFFTVALPFTSRIPVSAPGGAFFIGLIQYQSNAGLRVGVDSSSGSAGTSWIRAPTCGAVAFATLDSLGFPGNWVIRAVANEIQIPVELMTIAVEDS